MRLFFFAFFLLSRRSLLHVFCTIVTTGRHTSLTASPACCVAGLIGFGGLMFEGSLLIMEFTRSVGGETRDREGKVLFFSTRPSSSFSVDKLVRGNFNLVWTTTTTLLF